jgi:hypothetical protein
VNLAFFFMAMPPIQELLSNKEKDYSGNLSISANSHAIDKQLEEEQRNDICVRKAFFIRLT